MKKRIIIVLAIAVLIVLSGCGQKEGTTKKLTFDYEDAQVMDSMISEVSFNYMGEKKQRYQAYLQVYEGTTQLKEFKTKLTDEGESILTLKISDEDGLVWTIEGLEYSASLNTADILEGMEGAKAYISNSSDISEGRAMLMVINIDEDETSGDILNFVEDSNFEGILDPGEHDYTIIFSVGIFIDETI